MLAPTSAALLVESAAVLPADVVTLYRAFAAADAPVWLMGGWGIDALLGRQTRRHHDLDVLVEASGS